MKYAIFFAFLVFSMVSNILGVITPLLIEKFSLSLSQGGLLTFSFMIAFGIFSIPAGVLSDKYGKKKVLLLGIAVMFLGVIAFLLSSQFKFILISTLTAGIGVTFIQVGANTLVEDISKAGEYVKNLNITHAIFGIGSFFIPLIVGFLLKHNYDWRTAYLFFTILAVPLFFIVLNARVPKHTVDEKFNFRVLFKKLSDKNLMAFAFGLFLYVGVEMGIATWLIVFLRDERGIGIEKGVIFLSLFWAFLAVGRYIGGHMTHKYSPRTTLSLFTAGAIISLAISVFMQSGVALYFLPFIGFFLSIMFPTMFSVAIENTRSNKGTASGVLMSMVLGGAVMPYIMGTIGDKYGLTVAFSILFLALGYIFFLALNIRRKHIDIEKDLLKEPIIETFA